MKLNPGVTPINVVALIFGCFVVVVEGALLITFTQFLLEDRYGITAKDAAPVLGNVGSLGDLLAFCTSFFIGYGLDLFGRKRLSIAALFVVGTATLCTPIPENLSWLYVLTSITLIGFLPLSKSPYFIDYFKPESLGRAYSVMEFVAICGTILATSVALQISKDYGAAPVYFGFGGLVYLVSLFLCFGLKDVQQK